MEKGLKENFKYIVTITYVSGKSLRKTFYVQELAEEFARNSLELNGVKQAGIKVQADLTDWW